MARAKAYDPDEVLHRAMELFWQKGYHATSVQDLVTALGISRSSLYETFADKETLYLAAIRAYRQKYSLDQLPAMASLRTVLDLIFHDLVYTDCDRGCFMVNATVECAHELPALQQEVWANLQGFLQRIEPLIVHEQYKKTIDPSRSATELCLLIFSQQVGMRVLQRAGMPKEELRAIYQQFLQVLFV